MASWKILGKNASDTAAKAMQQAKNISEVGRLNGLIAEEKKKIEDTYYQLGQQYAKIYEEDYEPAFAELMTALHLAKEKIEQYQSQIQNIKGIVICPACNAEIPKGAAFCSGCGASVPVKKEETGTVCASCGAVLGENIRFCIHCGTPLAKHQAVVEAPIVMAAVCRKCGAELENDAAFCAECGTKVD